MDSGHDAGNRCWTFEVKKFKPISDRSFANPGYKQTGSHPAACVSWRDARSYVSWLSRKTGHSYRLLSEAEWEYSARAGTDTRYYFGSAEKELCNYSNHGDRLTSFNWRNRSCTDKVGDLAAKVGQYAPNGFGLFDMLGNVWGWTEDCWNDSFEGAPADNQAWVPDAQCPERVLRGGSWSSSAMFVRSATRSRTKVDFRFYDNGIRVARTLD